MAKLAGQVNKHVMKRVFIAIEGVLNGVNFHEIPT